MPRPSPMPPAATTGMPTASATCGTSAIVVRSPTCPPLSPPSAITASTPARSTILARAVDATTGRILTPASFHIFTKREGLPAPVVTTGTFSSATIAATSSTCGLISMMFTPKGLSVIVRHLRISSRTQSAPAFIAEMMPRPPALETALAREASAIHAMPPWMIGCRIPSSFVSFVCMAAPLLTCSRPLRRSWRPVRRWWRAAYCRRGRCHTPPRSA